MVGGEAKPLVDVINGNRKRVNERRMVMLLRCVAVVSEKEGDTDQLSQVSIYLDTNRMTST